MYSPLESVYVVSTSLPPSNTVTFISGIPFSEESYIPFGPSTGFKPV